MRTLLTIALCAAYAGATLPGVRAQSSYEPSPPNIEARQWFQDARFGMFIHWGVYSVLADGEWVMNNRGLTVQDYEKLAPQFNPTEFDPADWVSLAKAAGMKYITITTKHHDGFAMFDSKLSNWDIVERTPYKRDVIRMLVDECHRQGIKIFFYHSQLDWHHPDYFPRGNTGRTAGRAESGDWFRYLDYMDGQLRELLTNYGDIGGIWFDGMWDRYEADWRLDRTYKLIHDLQPHALVGSNHYWLPYAGEDFQMFEKDLPGRNTAGFNTTEVGRLPLETCETMNGSWGFKATDNDYKSTKDLIAYVAGAAGNNANFLLNVGPMANGRIQPEFVTRLREVGAWMATNGESIYGTRGGPIGPRPWGVTTQKGQTVYVHVLDWEDTALALPPLPAKIRAARLLADGRPVPFTSVPDGVVLQLPKRAPDDYDLVVKLELER